MDNYFVSFRLLNHLAVKNVQAARVLIKNSLRTCTITGEKQLQKRNVVYTASSESYEPKRFVRC